MLNFKDMPLLRQQVYIGGVWLPARSGRTLVVLDPASGRLQDTNLRDNVRPGRSSGGGGEVTCGQPTT
jgi:hypothetical protein